MKKLVMLSLVVLMVLGLTISVGAKEDIKIAFCFQDLETEFWVASHKAITETLKENGIEVIEYNANGDANKQLEQVKDAIIQGVDGIIIIPEDGQSAVTIAGVANKANVPIGVYNRPPANKNNDAIVMVADNEKIAQKAVEYMVKKAEEKYKKTGEKITPLIMVGDLGDPNAVARRRGFYNAINEKKEIFNKAIEVPTKWDANTGLANLQSSLQANPDVDLLFTSSDFLFPTIRAVLSPLGKWKKIGQPGHIIMGGLDGDLTAGKLLDEGSIEATGVQDLYFEAAGMLDAMLKAIENGNDSPAIWLEDSGFALTQGNLEERRMDMWGNKLRLEKGTIDQ